MRVTAGATNVTTYFVLRTAADGTATTGATITDIDLQYVRSGSVPAAKVDATALATTGAAHADNKAIEIDATDEPGLYRVDWPDATFATGAREVILSVKLASSFTEHLRVELTGVDVGASGEDAFTGTLTVDDGSTGLQGAVVNIRRGGVLKASGTTDSSGEITDWVFGTYTYDIAVRLAGYEPKTDTMAISADSWTKTVSMTAIAISAPSAATLCTVQFRVKLSDTAVSGAVCKAKLLGINHASDGTILSNAESSDTTDAQGVAELELVQKGSIVKGSGLYKIWVEIGGNPVSSVETTIPSQSTFLFEDLLL